MAKLVHFVICGAQTKMKSRFEDCEIVLTCNRPPHTEGKHISEASSQSCVTWETDDNE